MATKEYYLSGMAKWAKVYPENRDERFDRWTLDLFLDDKSWGKLADSGLQLKEREEEDGRYVKISRSCTRKDKDGAEVAVDPPSVLNAEGEAITDLIGNGSEVTCKVQIYDTRMGKGHRLEAVRVDNLIEYEGGVEVDEDIDTPF